MEYCKKIILEKIQEQMDSMKGNKLILRIENFEDARFYLEIYQYCKELCKTRNMQFEAKLTLGAWEKLVNTEGENYYTGQLEVLDVVDKKNRITYYRNEIVDSPKLVLFLGTEYAEDKAGLNELFLLNPSMLENKIKNHYNIIFEKYKEIIRDADRKRLDHFYEELFRHVPKNQMHLSCIVDELPGNIETFEDLMQVIFSRLYTDWGIPNIDSFPVSKIKEKGKIQVLDKANQFVKRSKFKTQNDIKKAYQKIEAYKDKIKEGEVSWKEVRGFSSFGEFEQSLREYIAGKNIPANREKLCQTDFNMINDILDLKIQNTKTKKESQEKLYDEPFLMLQKALFQTLGLLDQSQLEQLENFQMEVESIKLAGIYGEDEDDDTRRSEEEYWNCVCRYCGGLLSYINEKGYLGKEKHYKLIMETDIFQGENTGRLIEEGLISSLNSNHSFSKMKFQINVMGQGKILEKAKFEWNFSERDGWLNTFTEWEDEFFKPAETGSYIPFGVLKNIEHIVTAQSEDDFFHGFSRREIGYQNLVEEFTRKYGKDYPEITKEYTELGRQFLILAGEICEKGFYQVLLEETAYQSFLETYYKVGELFAGTFPDDYLLESYRLFVNAFLLADSDTCIKSDLEVGHAVVPAYHPAALERLKEKIAFLTEGINGISQEYFEQGTISKKEIVERINFYHQISYINSSIDVLKGKNENLICQNMFGGYGIYSDFQFEKNFMGRMDHQTIKNDREQDFDKGELYEMTPEAKVIIRYIRDYIKTFPSTCATLDIAAIHYDDLSSVISALHYFTKTKDWGMEHINLYIYMPKEKSGKEGYLSWWLEQNFDEDALLRVQIFLNYYKDEKELEKKIQNQSFDVVFMNHILTCQEISFSELETKAGTEEVKFPMFYKPLPMFCKSKKREVEISQLQFPASKIHTTVMYKLIKKEKNIGDFTPRLVKTTRICPEKTALIEQLHKSAKWVICQDMGLDKHVLFQEEKQGKGYKIIGFSTGEGTFGEYNVLVSAAEEMVEDLKQRIKRKLNTTFGKWKEDQLEEAADHCVDIAKELNGSSLLKALNPEDEDIRNFLAYVLTTQYHKKKNKEREPECEIIISLDSYKHWFLERGEDGTEKLDRYPDFLQLSVRQDNVDENHNIQILAKLIECKLAFEDEKHISKAKEQIQNGYRILKEKFNPDSTLVERRYWFAQLYQVLVFEQINRKNNGDEYLRLSKELLGILNGNFTIQWESEIYTYWINRDSETEEKKEIKELGENAGIPTNQVIFGQQGIKELLTGKTEGEMISYEPVFEEEPGGEEGWMEPEEPEVWRKPEEPEGTEERKELEKEEGAAERTESEETITDEEPGKRRKTEEQRKSDIRKELEKSEEISERREIEEAKETEKWTESETDKKSGEWMEPNWWKEVHNEDNGFLDKLDKKEPEENKITPNDFEKPMEPKESEDTTTPKEQERQTQKQFRLDESQKVEVLLGKSKLSGEKITWNYTNRAMANRHLLITGKSGQGKTYAIQSFLMEFSKAGIPAIIFDYTEGFTTKKLDEKFKEQLQGKIKQNILKITRMPINPFLRQKINIREVVGEEILAEMTEEQIRQHSKEDSVAVASRIASILCHVYTFGDQQYATIYQVCKRGIDAYGDDMNFEQFRKLLEEMNTKESKTVLNKLTPFLDTNLFDTKGKMDWSEMLYNEGMVNVIQLTQIPRDMQIVATEFILWDMWYYSLLHGEENKPFIVVLDEAQNLDFGEKSPSNKILTEGRKFGWSGWFATQFLKGQLKEDEIGRLQQTSQRMYFRPPDNEVTSMAASIDQDRTHVAEWVNKLKKLQKGNCIVTGDSLFGEHGQKLVPLQIAVSSMEERGE